MPRIRRTAGSRRPAWCTRSTCRVRAQFGSLGQRTGIRLDSGIVDGSMVSIHYDPMLAKVISYAPTRRQSALVLADALARTRLHGLRTNRELLVNVLRHPAFLDGATDTAFFDTHGLTQLSAPLADEASVRLSAIAAALADAAHNRATAPVFGSMPSGWRNLTSGYQVKTLPLTTGTPSTASNTGSPEQDWCCRRRVGAAGLVRAGRGRPRRRRRGGVQLRGCGVTATTSTSIRRAGPFTWSRCPGSPTPGSTVAKGSLVAPMPGNVIRLGAAGRRHRHHRSAADLAGGDEDGAHHHRAVRRRARRTQRHDRSASRGRRRPGKSGGAKPSRRRFK